MAKAKQAKKEVKMDRRSSKDRRQESDRRQQNETVSCDRRKVERRVKVSRRRQIDPTTCERDYSTDEIEFMQALDDYKRSSGRMFPTCSEILEVIQSLGYTRRPVADADAPEATPAVAATNDPADDPHAALESEASNIDPQDNR